MTDDPATYGNVHPTDQVIEHELKVSIKSHFLGRAVSNNVVKFADDLVPFLLAHYDFRCPGVHGGTIDQVLKNSIFTHLWGHYLGPDTGRVADDLVPFLLAHYAIRPKGSTP